MDSASNEAVDRTSHAAAEAPWSDAAQNSAVTGLPSSEASELPDPGSDLAISQADERADEQAARSLARVMHTVRTMVSPGGCAWHEVQTHESLTRYLVEETAEFIDAVERELPAAEVQSELGDVLYQVLFHAAIAERDGEGFSIAGVADALNAKLIARHPHVFGSRGYLSVDELNAEWERLKEDAAGEQRGSRGPLEGIPAGMPTLARAAKVVDRLGRAGLINPAAAEGRHDDPFAAAIGPDEQRMAEVGIGDGLLSLVTRAHAAGVDPDRALRLAVDRLAARALHTE